MIDPQTKISQPAVQLSPRRLIVLTPSRLGAPAQLAQDIRLLAAEYQRDVIYMALNENLDEQPTAARTLALLEAVTRDSLFGVSTTLVKAGDWTNAINAIYQPGDIIVCLPGQTSQEHGSQAIPAAAYFQKTMHIQTYELMGIYDAQPAASRGAGELRFWIGLLLILVPFTLMEFRLETLLSGAIKGILLVFLVTIEFGLIFLLNRAAG